MVLPYENISLGEALMKARVAELARVVELERQLEEAHETRAHFQHCNLELHRRLDRYEQLVTDLQARNTKLVEEVRFLKTKVEFFAHRFPMETPE